MTIDLSTRLYNSIVQWCEANGLETIKYIEKTLRERLAMDKYGDLNEKLGTFVEPETKTIVDTQIQQTEITTEPIVPVAPQEKPKVEVKKEEPVDGDTSVVEEKKKSKRTLKTK